MFRGCSVYYYKGLYLNESDLMSWGYKKASGVELASILKNYDDIYILDELGIEFAAKDGLIDIIGSSHQEYFYLIREGKFVLAPVDIRYGICGFDDKPVVLYSDQSIRDIKLTLVNSQGIETISEDIEKAKGAINILQSQQQLKKVYNSIRMIIE